MKNKTIIIALITLIVGGGAGFFGGMKYQQGRRMNQFAQFANSQGARGGLGIRGNGSGGNFRPVAGQIISADSGSITVKMSDGSSKIVILNDKTVVNQTSSASSSDLKTGQEVAVFGTNNSDGSVTATNVQLNPQQFRGNPNPTGN
jgi:hypothetical protein